MTHDTTPQIGRRGTRKCPRLALSGLVLSAILSVGMASAQPAKTSDDDFRQKYRQAAALAAEKKQEEAKKLFLELWSKAKSHEVATSLGQIELVSQRYASAAQYLSYAIGTYPAHQDEKQLTILRKWLDQASKHVASYELSTNVSGATLNVDGADFGKAPLDAPLFLEPGRHLIMIDAPGYKRAERSLVSTEGSSEKLEITLVAETPPAAAPVVQPPVAAPTEPSVTVQPMPEPPRVIAKSKPNPWVLVGGGAVTVGGVVTGLIFNAKASSHFEDAQQTRDAVGSTGCYESTNKKCSAALQDLKDGDQARNVSYVSFAVSGAALLGTVAYWLWPRSKSSQGAAGMQSLVASSSANGTWLGVSGQF